MKAKARQFELSCAGQTFNLAGETGDDPVHVAMERGRAAAAAEAGRRPKSTRRGFPGAARRLAFYERKNDEK